jgi:hypothetical protein
MDIWNKVLEVAAANGIWALLFVGLLIFELQDSRKREGKYQETISALTKDLDALQDVETEVKEIKTALVRVSAARKKKEDAA